MTTPRREKYRISIDQICFFGHNGYLKVQGIISDSELEELDKHSMNMATNRVDLRLAEDVEPRNEGTSPKEHALHRHDIGTDQDLQDIQNPGIQHKALVDFQVSVKLDEAKVLVLHLGETARETRPGLSSGLLLHRHGAGHPLRGLDCDRRLR